MKTLKYALRFLLHARVYTVINLLGLAFSLACSIILMRYIHREVTVDSHCIDRNAVYGIQIDMEGNRYLGGLTFQSDSILINPDWIETKAVVIPLGNEFILKDGHRYPLNGIVTDNNYFKLFPHQVMQGELSLDNPESILLKEELAQKLFGKTNPIGQTLQFSNEKELIVKGILKEPANKTFLNFDIVISSQLPAMWSRMPIEFYKFNSGADLQKIAATGQVKRPVNPASPDWRHYQFRLISAKDLYWSGLAHSTDTSYNSGNPQQLRVFIVVCIILLLTGLLNFINLYLIFMQKRSREYCLKKIFGASRTAIFLQIYLENLLLILAALIMAWAVIELASHPIARFFEKTFPYTPFDAWLTLGLLILFPLLSALYPYRTYTQTVPAIHLHSNGNTRQSIRLRMSLLFLQYTLTFVLVVLAGYFNKQLNTMLQTNPGFRTKDILIAKLTNESEDYRATGSNNRNSRSQQIASMLDACPDIEAWVNDATWIGTSDYILEAIGNDGQVVPIYNWYATPKFFQVYGLHILEGEISTRNASGTSLNDFESFYVLNKTAMKALGYTTCQGKSLKLKGTDESLPIMGVIDDYYDGRICDGIRPMAFSVSNFSYDNYHQIAFYPGKEKEVLAYLKKVEKEVYGVEEFEYDFMENKIKEVYASESRIATLYNLFAGMAVIISCLGLFGLSLFDIRQRYREIALRKVNGATGKDLYLLLSKKYFFMLGLAFVIALPISWVLIYYYTLDFAVKVPVGFGIFLTALLIVSLITIGTLCWQIRKAVRINPANIMRAE
ncbi:ABC transporter permease [uncultured Bacteroides sp.]|uniref:ABC transporter permease n=1 Tax=uncultured Bacteroides sp. TaxID=162156 RepID=UPI00260395ED|nr:ABC transporter permease [uncultured Bacteroides sp.]